MGISPSMFNHGNWRSPNNEGPVEKGTIFMPINEEGQLEPIKTRQEFDRLYALIKAKNFLGSLNRDAISIGLENIKFNKETKLYTINISAEVKFPTSKKPMGRQNVDFVVKLDDLDKPQYPEISLFDTKNEEKFRDSISNVLKHWFPSIDNGLPDEAARENLINDIQRRSMTSLLDQIVMPRLKQHRRERLENTWNNLAPLPNQSRQLGIHNPLLYQEVTLLPNRRSGSSVSSVYLPARDNYPSQARPELN